MSTHRYNCVVCGKVTLCTSDAHALSCTDGGCYSDVPVRIEFCSFDCFVELEKRMEGRLEVFRELLAAGDIPAPGRHKHSRPEFSEGLRRVGMNNAVVYAHIRLWQGGHVGFAEAMARCVVVLADTNEAVLARAIKAERYMPTNYLHPTEEEPAGIYGFVSRIRQEGFDAAASIVETDLRSPDLADMLREYSPAMGSPAAGASDPVQAPKAKADGSVSGTSPDRGEERS